MGRTYIRTLSDCDKHGLVIRITCWQCERVTYRSAYDFIGKKRRGAVLRGNVPIGALSAMLVCKGGQGVVGCGAREPEVQTLWLHELPPVPVGVPVVDFLNGDERERKRLIRRARG